MTTKIAIRAPVAGGLLMTMLFTPLGANAANSQHGNQIGSISIRTNGACAVLQQEIEAEQAGTDDNNSDQPVQDGVRSQDCQITAHARRRGSGDVPNARLTLERQNFSTNDNVTDTTTGFNTVSSPRTTNSRGGAGWTIPLPEDRCDVYRVRGGGVISNELLLGLNSHDGSTLVNGDSEDEHDAGGTSDEDADAFQIGDIGSTTICPSGFTGGSNSSSSASSSSSLRPANP